MAAAAAIALIALLLLLTGPALASSPSSSSCGAVSAHPYCHARHLRPEIRRMRASAVRLAQAKYLATPRAARLSWSVPRLVAEKRYWGRQVRRLYTARAAIPPLPHLAAFMCIYHHEASDYGWGANTGNGYYGGLQMDWSFMRAYGAKYLRRWGPASNWPWWAQIDAAENALRHGRGFYPWPNTARRCGLI